MSHEPSHSTAHISPPPAQAEDEINWFAVIGTGLGAIIVFAIATFVVYRYLDRREKFLQPGGPAVIPRLDQAEVGIVDQVPFDVTRAVQAYRNERIERLSTWGWMDRGQGAIHMPIDRAMDLVVQKEKERKEQGK
jgi:hypothetical protein